MKFKQAIVLFAHGSRDADWSRPFEKICSAVARELPGITVKLAYLDLMRPSLDEAIGMLAREGVTKIRVVPLFFGLGGHVREDLPRLVTRANPGIDISIAPPIGEQAAVIEAIAAAIAAGNSAPR